MYISRDWLEDYVDLSEFSDEKISSLLLSLGHEVEGYNKIEELDSKIVVGRIVESRKQLNTDTLSQCRVEVGKGEVLDIVCSARNVRVDLLVIVAKPTSKIPGGQVMKETTIRGQKSSGMLCSEKDLGISDEDDKIIELSSSHVVGRSIAQYLSTKDTIFDVSITPNRGDCLSYIGLARDLAAKLNTKVNYPLFFDFKDVKKSKKKISVKINTRSCLRFLSLPIDGIEVHSSSLAMTKRLWVSGMRAVNLVVDVTNYVLLEFGQPIHAYDFDKLASKSLKVEELKREQKFRTLDGVDVDLKKTDIVICDSNNILAVAGVMGGQTCSVSDASKNIVLEVAHFDSVSIRNTAKRLGLQTEASHRFERKIDIANIINVARRVVYLLKLQLSYKNENISMLCGDIEDVNSPQSQFVKEIEFSLLNAKKILGIDDLNLQECQDYFERLSCIVIDKGDGLLVKPPSWRNDIIEFVDLVEEVARIKGFDMIPSLPPFTMELSKEEDESVNLVERCKDFFATKGMCEVVSYPFCCLEDFSKIGINSDDTYWPSVELENPLSGKNSFLRTSLIPSLLNGLNKNRNHGQKSAHLFEVGRGFWEFSRSKKFSKSDLYFPNFNKQEKHLGRTTKGCENRVYEKTFLSGVWDSPLNQDLWFVKSSKTGFFDGKSVLESFLKQFGLNTVTWLKASKENSLFDGLHPQACAYIMVQNKRVGWLGELHPQVSHDLRFGLTNIPLLFELDLDLICSLIVGSKDVINDNINKFPSVERDLSFEVGEDLTYNEINENLSQCQGLKLFKSFIVFDVYRGQGVSDGCKSMSLRFVFQNEKRTLTDKEVDREIKSLIDFLTKKLKIKQR
jgi:phenylalanyl-tRNA synthetase beta chain